MPELAAGFRPWTAARGHRRDPAVLDEHGDVLDKAAAGQQRHPGPQRKTPSGSGAGQPRPRPAGAPTSESTCTEASAARAELPCRQRRFAGSPILLNWLAASST